MEEYSIISLWDPETELSIEKTCPNLLDLYALNNEEEPNTFFRLIIAFLFANTGACAHISFPISLKRHPPKELISYQQLITPVYLLALMIQCIISNCH